MRFPRKRRSHGDDLFNALYVLPAVVVTLVFLGWPVVNSFRLSLYSWDLISDMRFIGLAAFQRIFDDPVFWKAVGNTLIFGFTGPLLQTSLALVLAVLIASSGRMRVFYRTAVFSPVMLAAVAVGMIWTLIYSPAQGLLNGLMEVVGLGDFTRVWLADTATALPAVLVATLWKYTGFNVVIYLAGLQALPGEVYEAAELDGASRLQRFFLITLPLIAPFTVLNFLINVIGYLKLFDMVFITTRGGPNHATELISTYIYKQAFEYFNIGPASAAAVMLFLITALIVASFLWLSSRLNRLVQQ